MLSVGAVGGSESVGTGVAEQKVNGRSILHKLDSRGTPTPDSV
jgi:hypothetical protein